MALYEVGKPYVPSRTQWPEAVEYNFRGGEHELRMFLGRPSPAEVVGISRGPCEFGLYVDGPVIFFLYRFPGAGLEWSDAPYSIHLVTEAERIEPEVHVTDETRALLHVVMVDAESGIVRALRAVTLSPALTEALHGAIRRQLEVGLDPGYDRHLAWVYSALTSRQMVERAVARCRGGE